MPGAKPILARNLRQARWRAGLTLNEVAERVGLKLQTIWRYEAGALADVYHRRVEELTVETELPVIGPQEGVVKSPTQEKLEYQRPTVTGEPGQIRQIVIDVLEKYQGRRNWLLLVAIDLEVTDTTVHNWCKDLGIALDDHRYPAPQPVA